MNKLMIRHSWKSLLVMILTSLLVLNGCVQNGGVSSKRTSTSSNSTKTTGSSTGSNTAVSDTTTTDSTTVSSTKVELTHLVDPYLGTYKTKITIPKNYKGYLYIAGLNLSVLASKIIYVRLNFGLDGQALTLPATLARGSGITPNTSIQVLVLDLTKSPLQDFRLPYDLYDYNDYNGDTTLEPVTDPLNSGLYCRGLKLADDPTFTSANDANTCVATTDKCLYAYAKVQDQIFYSASTGLTSLPTKPLMWSSSASLTSTLTSGMCFSDYDTTNSVNKSVFGTTNITNATIYKGPYRPINQDSWQISSSAIFGSATTDSVTSYTGLFAVTGNSTDSTTWYRSLLFPREGTVSINSGVNYVGATTKFSSKGILSSDSTGTSKYIDGCSIRAQYYDSSTNEGIGSCTVNATMEVFYLNGTTEVSITKTNALKIQLTKASTKNTSGVEVLASNFKMCDSSVQCGADECCYNNRCWSKDLVSQCTDDVTATGNREIGTSCTSDYQCGSLCCNSSTGVCAPHNPTATTPLYCGKLAGQSCVSQEFCAKEAVPVCKLYKNGYNTDGTVKCTVRCPTVETYGTCVGGTCVAPTGSTDTSSFDLTTCSGAIDP